MKKEKLDPKELLQNVLDTVLKLRRDFVFIFIGVVVILYGLLLMRLNNLVNQQPSSQAVSQQVQTANITKINPTVVDQLKSLQDNSVSVQTLFNNARANPFQE